MRSYGPNSCLMILLCKITLKSDSEGDSQNDYIVNMKSNFNVTNQREDKVWQIL